mmetsp:Transcript_34625/g.100385  ORF Transcript_34625/g.100385 Transcript_34625/m.100385 type:complete len:346 (-) Transcript_34625:78-1115(-)
MAPRLRCRPQLLHLLHLLPPLLVRIPRQHVLVHLQRALLWRVLRGLRLFPFLRLLLVLHAPRRQHRRQQQGRRLVGGRWGVRLELLPMRGGCALRTMHLLHLRSLLLRLMMHLRQHLPLLLLMMMALVHRRWHLRRQMRLPKWLRLRRQLRLQLLPRLDKLLRMRHGLPTQPMPRCERLLRSHLLHRCCGSELGFAVGVLTSIAEAAPAVLQEVEAHLRPEQVRLQAQLPRAVSEGARSATVATADLPILAQPRLLQEVAVLRRRRRFESDGATFAPDNARRLQRRREPIWWSPGRRVCVCGKGPLCDERQRARRRGGPRRLLSALLGVWREGALHGIDAHGGRT